MIRTLSHKSVRGLVISALALLTYVGLYFGTTYVKPQGNGDLSGPQKVRVFASETHLAVFYPPYLLERWVRNGSFTHSSSVFNVDFKDRCYAHFWLYDDGKYGEVWYADTRASIGFFTGAILCSLGTWRLIRLPVVISVVLGFTCALLMVFAIGSSYAKDLCESENASLKAGHPEKALMITVSLPEKQRVERYVLRPHADISWGDSTRRFASRVWGVHLRGFRVLLRVEQPGLDAEVKAINFSYDSTTKTNWHGMTLEGRFQ